MKKNVLFVLMIFSLISCSKQEVVFDEDFTYISSTLKNDSFAFNSLIPSRESEYVFSMPNIDLKIRAYYKEFKEQFRYVLILNFDYLSTEINDIRIAGICINNKSTIIGQVGFNSDKKTISNVENIKDNKYKGIQIFLSPYIKDESVVRFYFESSSSSGAYYQINNLMEYK